MTSFIYSVNHARVGAHLGYTRAETLTIKPLPSKLGLEVRPTDKTHAVLLSGKDKDTEVRQIGPNQRASIHIGRIYAPKYQAKVVLNPALFAVSTAQIAEVIEPGEGQDLVIYITAHQRVDLAELQWLVRLYSYS
jgi:hypothetical protein